METRASYIVVGAFTLLVVLASVIFVLWSAKRNQGDIMEYEVLFRKGVTGLSIGNSVLFEGVRVGQVSQIKISPREPGTVHVHVSILADTPVRENSTASLEPQGITGLSIVAITGGTADSPMLKPKPGRQYAQIKSSLSQFQAIIATVPDVLSSANQLLRQANTMLSKENIRAFSELLNSLNDLSKSLAEQRGSIARISANLEEASRTIAVGTKRFDALTRNTQKLVTENFTQASNSVDRAAKRLDKTLEDAGPGIVQFSRRGTGEVYRLLVEAKELLQVLNRLTHKIESDPRRFLFGNPVPEYTKP